MIVHPDFLDHRKTRKLVELSGDERAPFWVLRLWAYCQYKRKSVFDDQSSINCGHIADVCRAPIPSDKLLTLLIDCGFVEMNGKLLVVHDWDQVNRMLVSAWENGKKGGHPTRSASDRQPGGNQSATGLRARAEEREDKIRAGYRPVTTQNDAAKGNPLGKGNSFLDEEGRGKERKRHPTLKLVNQPVNPALEHRYDLKAHTPVPLSERKFGPLLKKLANDLRANYQSGHGGDLGTNAGDS